MTPELSYLVDLETQLDRMKQIAYIQFQDASKANPNDVAEHYRIYTKLRERLLTVQETIIQVTKGSLRFDPPSAIMVTETENIMDELGKAVTDIQRVDHSLKLLSRLFDLIALGFRN